MASSCCVTGCQNNVKNNKAVTFHSFPSNEERKTLWLKNLNWSVDDGKPWKSAWYRVCSVSWLSYENHSSLLFKIKHVCRLEIFKVGFSDVVGARHR